MSGTLVWHYHRGKVHVRETDSLEKAAHLCREMVANDTAEPDIIEFWEGDAHRTIRGQDLKNWIELAGEQEVERLRGAYPPGAWIQVQDPDTGEWCEFGSYPTVEAAESKFAELISFLGGRVRLKRASDAKSALTS